MELSADALKVSLDTVWVLLATVLIFWMCAGFAMIEAGFARVKHTVHVLAMNYAVVAIVTLGFWAVGFGLMFGNGSPFMGLSGFAPSLLPSEDALFQALSWTSVPLAAKFLFQMVFADTAATIVSGTVAERMKFSAYLLFSVFMVAFLYPITGHWIWGGGFLSQLAVPFQDFAGSTAVHSVGGWAALTGTLLVGPRLGRFRSDGTAVAMPAHNLSIATLGALILFMGWFGFNAGSTMAADASAIAHIAMTTMLGGAAGMASALVYSWVRGKPDLGLILNGTLAGLVAVTAGCNAISAMGAMSIGLIAGVLCAVAGPLFEKMRIDDPVGALPVHVVNGVWGTLAVGLFATKTGSVGAFDGLLYGGGTALLTSQIIGAATVGAFMLAASAVCWLVVKAVTGLRVPMAVEIDGLDDHEHGSTAYILHVEEIAMVSPAVTVRS